MYIYIFIFTFIFIYTHIYIYKRSSLELFKAINNYVPWYARAYVTSHHYHTSVTFGVKGKSPLKCSRP